MTPQLHLWYNSCMFFEYDAHKSEANKQKHGIDFEEAKRLWDDERMLQIPLAYPYESRFLCIGIIGGKHYAAIITYRAEAVRIISVRRARKEEAAHYENS
ncbi:toxin [Campylobacterota bacterium]|nr:toxin [Campylobacterota bacterium]